MVMERVRTRLGKMSFILWAKKMSTVDPHPEALLLWQKIVQEAETVDRAQLLDDIPHILGKDREKAWWQLPNYYPFFYGVSKALKPASYLEIGTRYGYSLVSVFCGARDTLRTVSSIDLQAYEHKSQNFARENLLAKGYSGEEEFLMGSSTDESIQRHMKGRLYDLVFVDGDHSYEGAYNDILFYWDNVAPGGYMMIDDVFWQLFSMGKKVLRAVKDAVPRLKDMAWYEFIGAGVKPQPSYDGLKLEDFVDHRTGLVACYRGLVLIKKQ